MKLVEVPANEAVGSKWELVVNEFMESGFEAAEIRELDGGIRNEYQSLHIYVKRSGLPIRCRTRNGRLYLVREVQSE